ncbi:MAG: tryptophan synthase subunit alpha, partial [Mariniphaga sp.]
MNRIDTLFKNKQENILSIYFTAGHPQLNDTADIIKTLHEEGVDMIEIGMPFSDPMADGPVIQKSSQKALKNGMSLKKLFSQLENIRSVTDMPLLLMGYLNPVMQYGFTAFLAACEKAGIDGVILPDLPVALYEEKYKSLFDKHAVYNIFLITPQTSEGRIRKIDSLSQGFIYMVASASTTGARDSIQDEQEAYFRRIKNMNLKNPTIIGFGISNPETFRRACQHAHGAIIGSAFVNTLEKEGNLK